MYGLEDGDDEEEVENCGGCSDDGGEKWVDGGEKWGVGVKWLGGCREWLGGCREW